MRKNIIAFLLLALFAAPVLVSADTLAPIQPTAAQLLTRVAALEAQEADLAATSSVACAATTSVATVPVGEPFILAWGSVGAMQSSGSSTQSMWTPAGAQSVTQQTPGNWVYSFTFYGSQGGSATCTATIQVTP
jgi:hypothetical protein